MDIKELQDLVRKHRLWLHGAEGGERADLGYADLEGADLGGADLEGADLGGADLEGADLEGADLEGADLEGANLEGANLRGANLRDADLRDADLEGADLRGANLGYADLEGANLGYADLGGADLRDADLSVIKYDLWEVLLQAQAEIPGLVQFLKDGRIDGSAYEGECACLVGTIAKIKGVAPHVLPDIKPDATRPVERWFLAIRGGDTPENNAVAKITMEWIKEFQKELSHSEIQL